MNFLEILVLTLNWSKLGFEIWPFEVVGFFCFFTNVDFSITGLNGWSKSIAFAQRWKFVIWQNFQLISERNTKKVQIRNFFFKLMHCFCPKIKNCNLLKVSAHVRKKYTKNSKFKIFWGSSLTLSAIQAAGIGAGCYRGPSSLPCTHMGRACRK